MQQAILLTVTKPILMQGYNCVTRIDETKKASALCVLNTLLLIEVQSFGFNLWRYLLRNSRREHYQSDKVKQDFSLTTLSHVASQNLKTSLRIRFLGIQCSLAHPRMRLDAFTDGICSEWAGLWYNVARKVSYALQYFYFSVFYLGIFVWVESCEVC